MGTFRPGQNCWRIEHADRAAILIDAGAFFGAVRSALLQAKRSVFIVGWDLDSRTRLVGEDCAAHDGWPVTLREFLVRLVRERPQLIAADVDHRVHRRAAAEHLARGQYVCRSPRCFCSTVS